jgi:hypothetical protein
MKSRSRSRSRSRSLNDSTATPSRGVRPNSRTSWPGWIGRRSAVHPRSSPEPFARAAAGRTPAVTTVVRNATGSHTWSRSTPVHRTAASPTTRAPSQERCPTSSTRSPTAAALGELPGECIRATSPAVSSLLR